VSAPNPNLKRATQALMSERCRRDAHFFLWDAKVIYSKDEHDATNPVKLFPDIPYLRGVLDCLLVSGRLTIPEDAEYALGAGITLETLTAMYRSGICFIEKSRDVFATNLTCGYLLWRARAYDHQLLMVQSRKEEDAANLVFVKEPHVARISFMEDHLPSYLRRTAWPRSGAYARLYFDNGSQIWGIPEGGDVIRSNHPSVIFADEAAFQPEFGGSYTAALPAVKGGGQYIAVSSANPGEFYELVKEAEA
jgi:hypothetical protein